MYRYCTGLYRIVSDQSTSPSIPYIMIKNMARRFDGETNIRVECQYEVEENYSYKRVWEECEELTKDVTNPA